MGDRILDADEARTARSQVANPRIYGHVSDERVLALCNTVDALRARAEKAEAEREEARRLLEHCQRRAADANMSLFGVEQDNADLRTRLESVEVERDALKVQLAKQTRIVEQLNATRNRREDDIDALHEELHRREQAR